MDSVSIYVTEGSANSVINTVEEITPVNIYVKEVLGKDGADGAPGPVGGTYSHTQSIPSSLWTVNHNLGFFPNISVSDSSGEQVLGKVSYIDLNTLQIQFSAPFGGYAYIS